MPGVLKSLFLAAIATALATGVTAQDTQEGAPMIQTVVSLAPFRCSLSSLRVTACLPALFCVFVRHPLQTSA